VETATLQPGLARDDDDDDDLVPRFLRRRFRPTNTTNTRVLSPTTLIELSLWLVVVFSFNAGQAIVLRSPRSEIIDG